MSESKKLTESYVGDAYRSELQHNKWPYSRIHTAATGMQDMTRGRFSNGNMIEKMIAYTATVVRTTRPGPRRPTILMLGRI